MKIMRNMNVPRIAVALIVGLALYFGGCSQQSPIQSGDIETANSISTLAKENTYPQSTSRTYHYLGPEQGYEGGNVKVPGGSTLHLNKGSLTPPPDTPNGADVTITMFIERDTTRNELLFTFGPSGCQFDPPAEMWFDWHDLGSPTATLYYIDVDGNYIEQEPDDVDVKNKRMKLYIDGFSRYAAGME